jgi:hypothetical protein
VQKHLVVLPVFYHGVVVVETKKNEVDFDENVMVVESVVIANYRFGMEVMMVEHLIDNFDLDSDRLLLLPGACIKGGFGKTGFGSRRKMIYEIFFYGKKQNNILIFGILGSVFGFAVTSCDDDFLGIRNNEVTEVGGANGLLVVPVD